MIDINSWLKEIQEKLLAAFDKRVLFIGLQGSYNRNEANPDSDIDLVVILDVVTFKDLCIYKKIINSMPCKEKACGFISGKEELLKWSKHDLFHFYYDTKPIYNRLDDILKPPCAKDAAQYVKLASQNLYHSSVHGFLHSENTASDLRNLYKITFFILQAKYFAKNNIYISTKNELVCKLEGIEKDILQICMNKDKINMLKPAEAQELYRMLIDWCTGEI